MIQASLPVSAVIGKKPCRMHGGAPGIGRILAHSVGSTASDVPDRASIVAALERQLAKGDKALVGNTGFRRYLKTISEEHFAIDPEKIEAEKKFNGIFVLRTNTDLNPLEAMLCYKQLWTVEQTFRTNSKASALHPADLPQARRDHPRSRVLQLPRARAEVGAGGPHCTPAPGRRSSPIC